MRLRKRFQSSLALSLGATLALAFLLALSQRAASRADEASVLARNLQMQILERGIVRDEYLLHHEERAHEQWKAKSARIEDLIRDATAASSGPDEQASLKQMAAAIARSQVLLEEIATLPDSEDLDDRREAQSRSTALRDRLTSRLFLISHDLYSGASVLAESAARRQRYAERRALLLMIAMIALVLVIMVLNAILTSRLVERRITRLRNGAERVAAGDLRERVAIVGDDELADLGMSFDTMVAQLQESRASLEGRSSEVAALNAQLGVRVSQLESSNTELESFSYSVSHDLRAPLRHIHGFAALLLERNAGALDPKSQHYLTVISEAASKMGQLIDDLLSFSRMGRAEMMVERVDLGQVVDGVIRELSAEAGDRKIDWEITDLPQVRGDGAMLKQVWSNLLRNALKFTASRSRARIEIGSVPSGPLERHCFVRDNGAGFDMKHAEKLFGVFQRLHATEQFPGNGVGLANVKRIVQRHGGRVWAEGAPDQGATFWFSLPTEKEPI